MFRKARLFQIKQKGRKRTELEKLRGDREGLRYDSSLAQDVGGDSLGGEIWAGAERKGSAAHLESPSGGVMSWDIRGSLRSGQGLVLD